MERSLYTRLLKFVTACTNCGCPSDVTVGNTNGDFGLTIQCGCKHIYRISAVVNPPYVEYEYIDLDDVNP